MINVQIEGVEINKEVLADLLDLDVKFINGFVDESRTELAYSYDDGFEDLESTSIEVEDIIYLLKKKGKMINEVLL